MDFPGFLGPSYVLLSAKADAEEAINLYLERVESDQGLNKYVMLKSPGLLVLSQSGGGGGNIQRIRGMIELNDVLYFVNNGVIFSYDGVTTLAYGNIANDLTPVSMVADPDTLALVSADTYYAVSGGTLQTPALTFTPIGIAYIDGYFVLLSNNLRQFYFSTDPLTWDPADVQTAEADANKLLALIVHQQTLFIYGNRVTQAFTVGSNPDAPFVPQQNAVLPVGILAPATLKILGAYRIWLGREIAGQGRIYRSEGYSWERISNHAVENAIRSYGDVSDAVAWVYQLNGHDYYRISFPAANMTWEYDATNNNWVKTLYWNETLGSYEAHRGYCAILWQNKVVVGDRDNGTIYEMSPDVYSDGDFRTDGSRIRWERRSPHIVEEGYDVQYDRFRLGMETGVGDGSIAEPVFGVGPPPEADPQIAMSYSDDGGRTWSNELYRSMGKLGEYRTEVFWDRCGSGKDRVWKVTGSAAVKTALTSASFEGQPLK